MGQSQPPPPPEGRTQPPVIQPGTDDARKQNDFIEIQVPRTGDASAPTAKSNESSGCAWLFGGSLGCLVVIFGLTALLLVAAGQTVGGLIGGVADFFNLPGLVTFVEGAGVEIPEDVYIPEVERIQALSQLTTTRFGYSHLVTSEVEMPGVLQGLYGQGLAYVAVGHITAGVDLSQLTPEDIDFDEASNVLTVTLPAPVLQDCFLDESQSYVVTRNTGVFAQPSTELESSARRFAIHQYRDMALEDRILEEAQQQSVEVVEEFLATVSENVIPVVETDPIDPTVVYPETCD